MSKESQVSGMMFGAALRHCVTRKAIGDSKTYKLECPCGWSSDRWYGGECPDTDSMILERLELIQHMLGIELGKPR